ncbi:NAD-glutamate dehydrogenase [Maritalea porphyrae]|uniref:NAD-glutamate dehydrogenase n=1 Tax=Maritalea porphyrae TaxID=880732 RepID=UPI0022B043B9|nr:NAD-glutamate dehydrogenase [Maritalea porphyrae]MCZ4272415.1 NAD-glutamate dehydrogenase [Maritalea porphyrae]
MSSPKGVTTMAQVKTSNKAHLVAAAHELRATEKSFSNFLVHLINSIDDTDLSHYDIDEFLAIARQSYENLGKRQSKEHSITIASLNNKSNTYTIDVFNEDMPFIVDSGLAAIRASGADIRLFAHPVLPVKGEGKDLEVLETLEDGATTESLLHVHFDPGLDPKALDLVQSEMNNVLVQVRRAVAGWRPMLEKLGDVVRNYRNNPPQVEEAVLSESMHFLGWLADHNFTFLGMREYKFSEIDGEPNLEPIPNSGLGILSDPNLFFLRHGQDYVEMTAQHADFLTKSDPLMVTKANIKSVVHRRVHMDYIGIKQFNEDGSIAGELRIIGLFTSMSLATPHTEVPLLRRKVMEVMRRSGHNPNSHSGKALMSALDNYPREELFQIDEDLLFEFATTISALADRPRVRVLPRIDPFDNFVSIIMFMARDRYTSTIREQVGEYLAEQYDARVSTYYPNFPEGELVSVHFILGRNGGVTPRPSRDELEAHITDLTYSYGDRLLATAKDPRAILDYANAFTNAYQEKYGHAEALKDIEQFQLLKDEKQIAVRLSKHSRREGAYSLKLYHRATAIPLSARVPMLENFGFKVNNERTYTVIPQNTDERILHDMTIKAPGVDQDLTQVDNVIERAIKAVWYKDAENDGYNKLTVRAAMEWDDVSIIRALGRYLKQTKIAYSQRYMWDTLAKHPDVAQAIVDLFHVRHAPDFVGDRTSVEANARETISAALQAITSLDDDTIVRRFVNLVDSSLRTNFFQRVNGKRRPALAIKYDASKVDGLPEPRPFREIHVYSPRVEGVHLRGGMIARGGLRWSDRPEDFRTEVLGLVKAQMVKNAVIVPVGAKGGFVPKQIKSNASREEFLAEGTEAYKIFIGSLLDITDNLDGDKIIPPKDVTRIDGDDAYLVVAADKGTATFSDTANAISDERQFWLSDAFASGGSVGYDHKKMGITARGGWEAVKRHFRELDRDIQTQPFTAVGVGDMSGDVFGNGMLLSKATKLIAAFDHRDIFIDPNPDPATTWAERKRIFEMGRSSWQDYDQSLLSNGGGIYPRTSKSIKLSQEAVDALGLEKDEMTPNELMRAILVSKVDLLWFGGIGTYVRASTESDAEAGDRANDAIRITGSEVGAKAIGEGANLGITQLGRVEFARAGGRINTDAIDNSAGVNSSDLEVNIKIALGTLVRDGTLNYEQRNTFLAEMTDEVAQLCLRNNYLQTLAISLAERRNQSDLPYHADFMKALEAAGHLNRKVEYLPKHVDLMEREAQGAGLYRPELAVILAYAKNTLYAELLESEVPDDPYLGKELFRYFPDQLADEHPDTIKNHRLRREVIATVLCNAMINRGGPDFVHRVAAATGSDASQVAAAYAAARDSFGLTDMNLAIDALDTKIKGETQLELYDELRTLLLQQTAWFLRNVNFADGISTVVETYSKGIETIRTMFDEVLPAFVAASVSDQAKSFEEGGTPDGLAKRIAQLSALTLATEVVLVSERANISVEDAARTYFAVLETFQLGHITEQIQTIEVKDYYDRMALDRAIANLMRAQRDITLDVLTFDSADVETGLAAWHEARRDDIERCREMVAGITESTLSVSRLSVAAGLLSDLARG